MKKKLVVLLAVVMMFAFSASAYAVDFTDISEQPVTVQDAVAKTTALGIIEGYSDGTFGPEQNITRAEFAKIAVTAAGAKDTAAMLEKNASSFKDVKAGQWYTGWINASESLGIFQGDGNGNFRPNDSISNQEVITVLMRLLGYNDNLTGTWPVNYVTQANKVGILDDVTVVASAAAKRADVVVMLDDALDTDIVTYDKDTNEFVKKQTGISTSSYITLLEDSFKGSYLECDKFDAVDQVRDAAKEQLNWTVEYATSENKTADMSLIIDKDTEVSHNVDSLFDLEYHQGKVYFVEIDDKYYARFVEVESYTKLVSDQPKKDDNKIQVGKTNYNATKDVTLSDNVKGGDKNSKYVLYFNDDDQVYMAISDMDYTEQTYWVKSVGTNSVKLVGSKNKTANMNDSDTLIWNGKEFIAPSELNVGDAIMEIAENDLYVIVNEANGKLTKQDTESKKLTIDGSAYKYDNLTFLDEDYEEAGVDPDEVFGNNVKFIMNKDNTIAGIMVDETSTGTKLYGIVTDGDSSKGTWSEGTLKSITIFTAEGKNVTYDFDDDLEETPKENSMGKLIEYKLNKDGEIKSYNVVSTSLLDGDKEIEVKNNAYLVGNGNTVTLASNVVVFEVDADNKGKVDPTVVTRASVLAGGDFTPSEITIKVNTSDKYLKYCTYVLNNNGAAKALAYTTADGSKYNYGVVADALFSADGYDNALELVGDDNIYEGANNKPAATEDDAFIVYTLSGDNITVVDSYAKKTGIKTAGAREVDGYTNGLMTFKDNDAMVVKRDLGGKKDDNTGYPSTSMKVIMTDDETLVYVMNASTGEYEVGELSDIFKGAYVYVPVVDKDDYADVVLVDEYNNYTQITEDETYKVTLNEKGFAKGQKPSLSKVENVKYKEVVTLTIPAAAFTETGKEVTITVNGTEVEKPETGNYEQEFTITGDTTVTVERTTEDIVYTFNLDYKADEFEVAPTLSKTTAKYGEEVTLTIDAKNFIDENGGDVAIKVGNEDIQTPADSANYTKTYTVGEDTAKDTTVKVTRTVTK